MTPEPPEAVGSRGDGAERAAPSSVDSDGSLDGDHPTAHVASRDVPGGDGAGAADGLGGYIRAQRLAARTSLRALSRTAGVSNPYLSQIERGLRKPSAEILQAIAKALGISPEVLYVRAGILEEPAGGVDVERAIDDDPRLSPAQRRALRGVYQAFVGEGPP